VIVPPTLFRDDSDKETPRRPSLSHRVVFPGVEDSWRRHVCVRACVRARVCVYVDTSAIRRRVRRVTVEHQSCKFVLSLFLSLGVFIPLQLALRAANDHQYLLNFYVFCLNKPNFNSFALKDPALCL